MASSDLNVSIGNKAKVVPLDDGDCRGVQSTGVLSYVVVFNSNLETKSIFVIMNLLTERVCLVERSRIDSILDDVDLCWKLAVDNFQSWLHDVLVCVVDIQVDRVGEGHIVELHLGLVLDLDIVTTV